MADAMMESLGEANGVKWYWAEPGRFERPGVYYWDGTNNVLCVPYRAAPEAPAVAQMSLADAARHFPNGPFGQPRIAAPEAPAQANNLTAELQQRCSDWGVYWRAPDAHGVVLTVDQATELLRDALGVEVEVKAPAQAEVDLTPAEFCWLVEHFLGDGTGNSTGHYHTGFTDLGGNSRMTKDPYKAKRYATWREANLASMKLGHTLSGTWRAVQHGFAARIPEVPPQAEQSAGEVGRGDVVAFEFYNRATGHAIVDYSVNTHVGTLSADKGYEARPLVYADKREEVTDGSKPIPLWQAREALDELEAAARGDAPFNHQAAAVVRAALSHKEPQR